LKCEGFDYAFDPSACERCGGKCCTGESGYIWVDEGEIAAICAILGISREEFAQKYAQKVNFRYTLKEVNAPSGFACVFFGADARCTIYDARPKQCRSFPFWEHFKTHKKELEDECIGILPL
jgi:Fe-S-cluster containining protein